MRLFGGSSKSEEGGSVMSRTRGFLLGLLVVLALDAVFAQASSAATPAWWVEGNALGSGVQEAVSATTTVSMPFKISAAGQEGECSAVKVEGGDVEGEKGGAAKSIVFSECVDLTQKNCEVHPIATKPLKLTLEGEKSNIKLRFTPTAGAEAEMATITYSGAECAVSSVQLKGSMACNYPHIEEERVVHELEFTAGSGSKLKYVAGSKSGSATLTGIDEYWLAASGRKFSAK
jgi:hypothetical protein